jgi:hypothetical protein
VSLAEVGGRALPMTAEVLFIAAYRVLGSLPVLRWPFAGALLSIVVDLFDLLLIGLLGWDGIPDYQSLDKYLDQVQLALFLVVVVRQWSGVERRVAVLLYAYRIVGFVAFELTGDRLILLLFPNVFEFWFVLVAGLHAFRRPVTWTPTRTATALAVLTGLKEIQEWALHGARLFDQITFLDALRLIWGTITGTT